MPPDQLQWQAQMQPSLSYDIKQLDGLPLCGIINSIGNKQQQTMGIPVLTTSCAKTILVAT